MQCCETPVNPQDSVTANECSPQPADTEDSGHCNGARQQGSGHQRQTPLLYNVEPSVRLPDAVVSQCGVTHLPANIQHEFGSSVCRSLFPDEPENTRPESTATETNIVDETQSKSQPMSLNGPRLVLDPSQPGFQYEMLGRIQRANVVRGTGVTYDRGVSQTDYSASVFDRREVPMAPTAKHRNRRDDLSKWAEHNIIWTRQRKAWDTNKAEKKGSS